MSKEKILIQIISNEAGKKLTGSSIWYEDLVGAYFPVSELPYKTDVPRWSYDGERLIPKEDTGIVIVSDDGHVESVPYNKAVTVQGILNDLK